MFISGYNGHPKASLIIIAQSNQSNSLISPLQAKSWNLKTHTWTSPLESVDSFFKEHERACLGVTVIPLEITESIHCFYGCFYSLIQPFHIAESILGITFGMSRCARPHLYEWTESNRYLWMYNHMEKTNNFVTNNK